MARLNKKPILTRLSRERREDMQENRKNLWEQPSDPLKDIERARKHIGEFDGVIPSHVIIGIPLAIDSGFITKEDAESYPDDIRFILIKEDGTAEPRSSL